MDNVTTVAIRKIDKQKKTKHLEQRTKKETVSKLDTIDAFKKIEATGTNPTFGAKDYNTS